MTPSTRTVARGVYTFDFVDCFAVVCCDDMRGTLV